MEKELIIKIDLEKITKDVLEKEIYSSGNSGYAIIQERVKNEIKDWIKTSIVDEIKLSLNLEEFRTKNYSKDYLKQEANKILDEELESLIKERIKEWIKQNIRWIIEKQAEKNINEFLVPRLQKTLSNLIIINTESVEQEMKDLRDDYEAQIRDIEEKI